MGRRTTPFSLRGTGTRRPPISRGVILTRRHPRGAQELYVVHRDDARRGRITLLSCADIERPRWKARDLLKLGLGAWEPTIDPERWAAAGEIHLLVQAVSQRDGNDREAVATPPTSIGVLVHRP